MTYSNNNINKNNERRDIGDEILDWFESFIFSMFVILLIFTFLLRLVEVEGTSMLPTLENGDRLVISHLFYKPKQGDVVVLNSEGLNKTIVKRVIATERQTVVIDYEANTVEVNGELIDEPFLSGDSIDMEDSSKFSSKYLNSETGKYVYRVPNGCIFVLGDNRNMSSDSRVSSVGFVKVSDVLGKAVFRLFPFGSIGRIK